MVVRRAAALTFALVGLAGAFIAGTGAAAVATDGDTVIVGQVNTETFPTTFSEEGNGDGVDAYAGPGGPGVLSAGVFGHGPEGIYGRGSQIGVEGSSDLTGVLGASTGDGDGVDGTVTNSCCSAVYGHNLGTGNGVAGRADTGTGVLAASTNGTALSVQGTFVAQRSGLATVATGQIYKQVSLTRLSASSFIVATVQGATVGVWVQRVVVNPAGSYFRIYLNKAATAATKVGWFAIN
jgi:hypothetical protein